MMLWLRQKLYLNLILNLNFLKIQKLLFGNELD